MLIPYCFPSQLAFQRKTTGCYGPSDRTLAASPQLDESGRAGRLREVRRPLYGGFAPYMARILHLTDEQATRATWLTKLAAQTVIVVPSKRVMVKVASSLVVAFWSRRMPIAIASP